MHEFLLMVLFSDRLTVNKVVQSVSHVFIWQNHFFMKRAKSCCCETSCTIFYLTFNHWGRNTCLSRHVAARSTFSFNLWRQHYFHLWHIKTFKLLLLLKASAYNTLFEMVSNWKNPFKSFRCKYLPGLRFEIYSMLFELQASSKVLRHQQQHSLEI